MQEHLIESPLKSKQKALPTSLWIIFILSAGLAGYICGNKEFFTSINKIKQEENLLRHKITKTQNKESIFKTPEIELNSSSLLNHNKTKLEKTKSIQENCPKLFLGLGEHTIADIVSRNLPSIVSLEVMHKNNTNKNVHYFYGSKMRPTPDFPSFPGQYNAGTGIIVSPRGYILTNSHVARLDDEVRVSLFDRSEHMAQIVARDRVNDLALLKIDTKTELPSVKFCKACQNRAGDWVVAIGSPMRLENSVSVGIISGLKRSIGDPIANVDMIQTDAAINPGSSGGPLLNLQGEVIGINTVVRADAQNISFAIPSDKVLESLEKLIKGEKHSPNYIGVRMSDFMPQSLKNEHSKIVVISVEANSPGMKAGLSIGDIIKTADKHNVTSYSQVKRLIQSHRPGDFLNLGIERQGKEIELNVLIESLPENLSQN